jgi:hypothetical protein
MSPNGRTQNQIDQSMIHRQWHSSALDVQSLHTADCDTDQCLVLANVWEIIIGRCIESVMYSSHGNGYHE